jgi:hypothetical protein
MHRLPSQAEEYQDVFACRYARWRNKKEATVEAAAAEGSEWKTANVGKQVIPSCQRIAGVYNVVEPELGRRGAKSMRVEPRRSEGYQEGEGFAD